MGRGTFKYICEDCGAENWLSARARSSRFRPKCIECGSTWLEPSKGSEASERIATAKAAANERIRLIDKKMNKIKE